MIANFLLSYGSSRFMIFETADCQRCSFASQTASSSSREALIKALIWNLFRLEGAGFDRWRLASLASLTPMRDTAGESTLLPCAQSQMFGVVWPGRGVCREILLSAAQPLAHSDRLAYHAPFSNFESVHFALARTAHRLFSQYDCRITGDMYITNWRYLLLLDWVRWQLGSRSTRLF